MCRRSEQIFFFFLKLICSVSNYICHFHWPHSRPDMVSLSPPLSLKSHSRVFRSVSSPSVYFLCGMSLSRDSSKITQRNTQASPDHTALQTRDCTGPFCSLLPGVFCWIPRHLSRPHSSLSPSRKASSIPFRSDLIPPCLLLPGGFVPLLF